MSRRTRELLARVLVTFTYGAITLSGRLSITFGWSLSLLSLFTVRDRRPHNPMGATPVSLALPWFGLIPVRSPLLGESRLIFVPPGTEMFQFPGLSPNAYEFSARYLGLATQMGFPIGRSSDHGLVGGSPKLIAASHVLHRQQMPRHPPHALSILLSRVKARVSVIAECRPWPQGHVDLRCHDY